MGLLLHLDNDINDACNLFLSPWQVGAESHFTGLSRSAAAFAFAWAALFSDKVASPAISGSACVANIAFSLFRLHVESPSLHE